MVVKMKFRGWLKMNHFFAAPDDIRDDLVIIRGQDVEHITQALRLNAGDEITVADGQENKYLVELTALNEQMVEGKIKEELEADAESNLRITLVQGLPKSKKMDLIVRKCTELGIDKIIPLETAHTVVKLDRKKAKKRQKRWQKIAKSAAKQSKRTKIPEIEDLISFKEGLELLNDYDLVLLPWVDERNQGLKEVIKGQDTQEIKDILVFVGPEGGFSEEEAAQARKKEAEPVVLGPRTLRTETAGMAVLTMLLYELGDLGG